MIPDQENKFESLKAGGSTTESNVGSHSYYSAKHKREDREVTIYPDKRSQFISFCQMLTFGRSIPSGVVHSPLSLSVTEPWHTCLSLAASMLVQTASTFDQNVKLIHS